TLAIEHEQARPRKHLGLGAADRRYARQPGAARRVDLDLLARLCSEERATEGRVGRDAADARDLEHHPLALLVFDLDRRADADLPTPERLVLDEHRSVQPVANRPDPVLQQALFVLRGVVLEVLGEVA